MCIAIRVVPILLVAMAVALCAPTQAAEQTWRRVSDFPATGLHASGSTVVAWSMTQYALSTDGGVSWSNPIAPTAHDRGAESIRLAVASPTGVLLLTTTGSTLHASIAGETVLPGPAVSSLAVDGEGAVFSEGIDGSVGVIHGARITMGRIYRAVSGGVLVLTPHDGLVLATDTGISPVAVRGAKLPPVVDLAPLTTAGGNRWTACDGTTWLFTAGKVFAFSERAAQAKAYGFGSDGYHELLGYRGLQITYEQGGTGLAGHWRTRDLPQNATVLTVSTHCFIVADARGIHSVPIARE